MAPPTDPCFGNGAPVDVSKPHEKAPLTESFHGAGTGAALDECKRGKAPLSTEALQNGAGGAPPLDVCKTPQENAPSIGEKPEQATEGAFLACSGAADRSEDQLWTSAFEWTLDFPLATVWNLTRDFVNISRWLPSYMRETALVEGTPQQPGCVRSVVGYEDHIPPAYDKLLEIDEHNHKFKYRILTCHLPLLMGHSPTFHFLPASPTSTILKFSTERMPVPSYDEQSYRSFVYELYSGFVSDLIKTLSTSA